MKESQTKPVSITSDDFQRLVIEADRPVIVDFWAQWCRPCVALAPSLEQLAGHFGQQLTIAKVNIEEGENEALAQRLHVQGFPSLLFYNKGVEVKRLLGAMPRAKLQIEIEQFLVQQGLASTEASTTQQEAFDAAVALAERTKDEREEAASAAHKLAMKPAFDALDEVRKELFKALADELPETDRPVAIRGAAGDFDEAVYNLFVTVRSKIDEEERFAALAERQNKAIEELNSGEGEKAKQAFFAEIEAAEQEYNNAVETARRTHLT